MPQGRPYHELVRSLLTNLCPLYLLARYVHVPHVGTGRTGVRSRDHEGFNRLTSVGVSPARSASTERGHFFSGLPRLRWNRTLGQAEGPCSHRLHRKLYSRHCRHFVFPDGRNGGSEERGEGVREGGKRAQRLEVPWISPYPHLFATYHVNPPFLPLSLPLSLPP
ncbi:hypothetical protein Naga_101442g2, partial [Nannochloropsis gaditana]